MSRHGELAPPVVVGQDRQDVLRRKGATSVPLFLVLKFRPANPLLNALPLDGGQGQVVEDLPVGGLVALDKELSDLQHHRFDVGLGEQGVFSR